MRWHRGQHLLFAVHQVAGIKAGDLESVPVGDGVCGTSFHAVAAENAAVVVNVINLGVTLGSTYAVFVGVLLCLDIDSIRRTSCGTHEASDTLLQAVFVALQNMHSPEALL